MEFIFILLSLHCEGKYSAQCYPTITEFSSREECENARIDPEWAEPNIFGYRKAPTLNPQKICFPSVKGQQHDK